MKKALILAACVIFLFSGLVYAEQKSSQSNAAGSQNPGGGPMQGMMGNTMPAGGMAAAIGESTVVIQELIKVIESSSLAAQNTALIQKAKDVIKKSDDAVKFFSSQSGWKVQSTNKQ